MYQQLIDKHNCINIHEFKVPYHKQSFLKKVSENLEFLNPENKSIQRFDIKISSVKHKHN